MNNNPSAEYTALSAADREFVTQTIYALKALEISGEDQTGSRREVYVKALKLTDRYKDADNAEVEAFLDSLPAAV